MKRLHKKGLGGIETIALLVLFAILIFAIGKMSLDQFDKSGNVWDNVLYQSCQAPDNEGIVVFQVNKGWCPCDIDDEDNEFYTGKEFRVKPELTKPGGVLRNMFKDDFFADVDEDNPLTISQVNVDEIVRYIEARTKVPPVDTYLQLDYQMNIYYNNFNGVPQNRPKPDLLIFCPSLETTTRANQYCQKEIFYADWFIDGTKEEGICATPDDECVKQVEARCIKEEGE